MAGCVTVTFMVTDDCDNSASTTATFCIADTEPPVIDPPAQDVTVECDGEGNLADLQAWLDDHGGARATDICCGPNELTWTNDFTGLSDDCCETGSATVTFTVTDDCGNWATTTATFTIVDTTPPVFDPPCEYELIKVFPNPGDCWAYVDLPSPTAYDVCCGEVEVVPHRSDGRPWGDPFYPGETNVWWTATDDCGNSAYCMKVIEVEDSNLMYVYLEMPGVFQPCVRCIHFEAWICDGPTTQGIDEDVVFVPNAPAPPFACGVAQLIIPCTEGLTYECMTAQDKLHTLRSTADVPTEVYETSYGYDRIWYVVEFTLLTDNPLIPGNLDKCLQDQLPDEEDWFIDILDFGVCMSQWAVHYCDGVPVEDPPFNGHTPCPESGDACEFYPHADINGDGVVDEIDVTFWRTNLLEEYQPNCCGQPGPHAPDGSVPTMAISVGELYERGWRELAAGDLNGDGWLDMDDVQAFLNGARPRPRPHVEPALPLDSQDATPSGSPDSRVHRRP